MMSRFRCAGRLLAAAVTAMLGTDALAADAKPSPIIPPASQRFAAADVPEVPDFGRHVVPLLGRLGCNGRACHGSFQGQGGFRLSLFGYDFKLDHEQLTAGDEPRVDRKAPAESLMLQKPTMGIPHEGGERMKAGGWEHRLLLKWIEAGAETVKSETPAFVSLDVTPTEIHFSKDGEAIRLQAIATWADGRREDVTPLCRFQTNDEVVAPTANDGTVSSGEAGDTHVVVSYDKAVVPIPVIRPVSDRLGPKYPRVPTPTEVDRLVVAKLRKLGIVPSDVCSDAEFLRRVSLDMAGTLPTAAEVEAFLADSTADKRDRKIDELLERPTYAAWWATKFCDWTGANGQQLNNVSPVQGSPAREWYDWVEKRFAENVPYDRIVEGVVMARGRAPEQSYEDYCKSMSAIYAKDSTESYASRDTMQYFWARRNLRQPEEKALAFAYSFMGIRIQCAQCHKHPFDVWTQDDYKQFQNFFTRIGYGPAPDTRNARDAMLKELGIDQRNANGNDVRRQLPALLRDGKVVPFDEVYVSAPRTGRQDGNRRNPRPAVAGSARVLGGDEVSLAEYDDPREPLMDWLRSRDNPYFAKAFVNRVWSGYFHAGIVNPSDDLSLANPPCNQALLDYLADGFVDHGFDMKWVHREIARSRTYQLSWVPNETNALDTRNFSRAVPRRMPAEVAYDAIRLATASDAEAAKMATSVAGRAIANAGPDRNRNFAGDSTYALTVFGRSTRDSNCDCDRSMEASLLQTVFLRNDQSVLQMIQNGRGGWVAQVTSAAGSAAAPEASRRDEPREAPNVNVRGLREELARLETRLGKVKADAADPRVAKARERVEALKREIAAASRDRRRGEEGDRRRDRREATESRSEPEKSWTPEAIVRGAYLRTLSRPPSDDELSASLAYIREAPDLAKGVEGVLWALLNTKEFIVNH